MQKDVSFQLEDAIEIPNWADAYPEHKFVVYKCCFLSTKQNSHNIPITDEVLREYGKTILGNLLVAKIEGLDCTTHRKDEVTMGYFPIEQEVEFVEEEGVTKAYAYAVVSRRYAEQFNNIFEIDNFRNSSVEMTVTFEDDTEEVVTAIDIYALCVLGKMVNGSCPDANIKMVRFSQKKAAAYFAKNDSLATLKKFAQERNNSMAEKTYKIDKSKEAMSEADWGDIDKTAIRDAVMEAENKTDLVKEVYLLVEDGWEDAPSEHLKYPVMELKDDTFVYNRNALSSALAYAKQNEEQSVVNKVEAIYKDLDIETDGKEEKKMSEIEFAAVNIGDLWERVYAYIDETNHWEYRIRGIYEQDNQKFAILVDREQRLYRLDFSLTDEGFVAAEEVVEVKEEFVETDEMKKFASVEDEELNNKYTMFEVEEPVVEQPTVEELQAKIEQMQKDIEDRDNIIMGKEAELSELREFKMARLEADKACKVEEVMKSVTQFMDKDMADTYRQEGLQCEFAELDGWANKVKASVVDQAIKNSGKKDVSFTRIASVIDDNTQKKSSSVWERL